MTPDATQPFSFRRAPRRRMTAGVVALIWAALLAGWIWLDAALWLMITLGLFTLPALYDLVANPVAGLDLTADRIRWFSGRRHAEVALAEVDHVRLDTRLDFSVRASVVLRTGRKIRLPIEATPPHRAFDTALQEMGIKTVRHHFQLMQ